MKKVLGIYCAGGFGSVAYGVARELNSQGNQWENILFIDDAENITNSFAPVISYTEFQERYVISDAEITIAAGEPKTRAMLFNKVKKDGYSLANLVHPMSCAKVIKEIGEGNIVCGFAYISEGTATLGNNIIVMPYAQISHNCVIGDHCVIASTVNISGNTVIGDRSYIGVGAKLREGISVGEDAIVGMGAVVTKSVDANSVVVGMPAHEIRKNQGKVFKG